MAFPYYVDKKMEGLSQKKKDKYWMISLICRIKIKENKGKDNKTKHPKTLTIQLRQPEVGGGKGLGSKEGWVKPE